MILLENKRGTTQLERKAEANFEELNNTLREYHEVFSHQFPPLPRKPLLNDFYAPSDEQHDRELAFIALSMIGIGEVTCTYKATL